MSKRIPLVLAAFLFVAAASGPRGSVDDTPPPTVVASKTMPITTT
ncbi:hypothetical protein [Skermanella mucosa]|nr:hypothetical protein [Skermanella mucosa]